MKNYLSNFFHLTRNNLVEAMNPYGQLSFPTILAFEPIQLCNAECYCCPYTWLKDDKTYRGKKMNRPDIERLLDEFGSVRKKFKYQGYLGVIPYRFSDPLVCDDLDLVLAKAEEYDFDVILTTNGLGFDQKKLQLLDRYHYRMTKITVSIIGSNPEEVNEMMGIKLEKVIKHIDEIADNWPNIKRLIRVNLRITTKTDSELNYLKSLQDRFIKKGIIVKGLRDEWLNNRVNMSEFKVGESTFHLDRKHQMPQEYIVGCNWSENLLRRLEVTVDGAVVLCCDDAEKNKTFGNIFTESIEHVWNGKLRKEHLLLLNKHYEKKKNQLICSNCTRAIWNTNSNIPNENLSTRHRKEILEKQVRDLMKKNFDLQQAKE